MPRAGWTTVTIPGAVSGWVALSKRFGKLPFADLFVPAIRYARDGYAVSPIIAEKWAKAVPILGNVPGFAEHFMPRGRAPETGELFASPAMAASMEKIAAQQRRVVLSRRARGSHGRGREQARRRPHAGGLRCASMRLGHAARARLSRPHRPRDSAERPGHRRADGARHARAFRPFAARCRLGRSAAPRDRGDEARFCRRLPLRRDPRSDDGDRLLSCSTAAISRAARA